LFAAQAEMLFSSADCNNTATIHRSMPFVWPNIPLSTAAGTEVAYQIRGFYDRDADFNPFYSIRNQPTAGDVLGGAFVNPSSPDLRYAPITFGSRVSNPLGQVVRNITVTLGAAARTERPMFELSNIDTAMNASATIPILMPGATLEELGAWEQSFWAQASMTLSLMPPESYPSSFEQAGIDSDVHSDHFAWYANTIDLDQDDLPDPHPILGSDNNGDGAPDYYWMTPMVWMMRAQTQDEIASGIPSVMFFGSPLNSELYMNAQLGWANIFPLDINILVPPVAVVNLNPSVPTCKVPYLAPNNAAPTYESTPKECQELPTGDYDLIVFHGFAGGSSEDTPVFPDADAGPIFGIDNGSFTGQVWKIPNELGAADSSYNPLATAQLPIDQQVRSQGPSGRFSVSEDTPEDGVRNGCDQALDIIDGAPGYRPIELVPVDSICCAAVADLCDLPLCGPDNSGIRKGVNPDESGKATCIPFLMPATCCPQN
jgi:hypothetical protein